MAYVTGCSANASSSASSSVPTSAPTPPSSSVANLAGNWQFTAASTVQAGYATLVEANIQQTGANLQANGAGQIFIAAENPSGQVVVGGNCAGTGTNQLTGSTSGNSVTFNLNEGGNTFTINGTLTNNGTSITGTYQSSGSGCIDRGTFAGALASPINGVYSGRLSFPDGNTDDTVATITETSTNIFSANVAVSGSDVGSLTLNGTVIGAGFSASGLFQGVAVEYLAYYDPTAFAIRVFEATSGSYVGILYAVGHSPTSQGAAFVQSASFTPQTTQSSFSAMFSNRVSSGDLIAVAFWWNNAQVSCAVNVSDSAGNFYTQALKTSSLDSNDWVACIYVAQNVNGGANLRVTVDNGAPFPYQFSMTALEYSGVSNVDVISTTGGTTGMAVSSGYASTHYADEVLLGVAVADFGLSAGPGFNTRFSSNYFVIEDQLLTAQGSYQATFLPTNTVQYEGWDAGMVALH